jgi:hypothetical protein
MLPAHKEATRLHVLTPGGALPTFAAFGNVVKSVQGLQQRLEDFTIEEVGAAHQTAQTLALRLADLQRKLTTVAEIKRAVEASRIAVDNALAEYLRAEAVDDTSEICLRIQSFAHSSNLIVFPRINKPAAAVAIASDASTHARVESLPEPPVEAVEDWTPLREPEQSCEQNVEAEQRDVAHFIPVAALETELGREEPQFTETAPAGSSVPFEADRQQPPAETLEPATTGSHDGLQPSGAAPTDFDQQLLDDLIQNYGEFAAVRRSRTTVQPRHEAPSTAPAAPAPEAPCPTDPADAPPATRGQREIDRQLKKIIKDYGEYDLYSHRTRISLTTGLVAALVLVALLISWFYYFSPKTDNVAGASSRQPESLQRTTVSAAGSRGDAAALLAPTHGDAPPAVRNGSPKKD